MVSWEVEGHFFGGSGRGKGPSKEQGQGGKPGWETLKGTMDLEKNVY